METFSTGTTSFHCALAYSSRPSPFHGGHSIGRSRSAVSRSRYFDIDQQVRAGCGWKQLRYIIDDTETLKFERYRYLHQWFSRDSQPTIWSSIIQQRNHSRMGAKVEIFVAKEKSAGLKDLIHDPENRDIFDNNAAEWIRFKYQNRNREMMIVLQRGKDAYIVEDGSGLGSSVSELFEDRSWQMVNEEARRLRAIRESESPRSDPNSNDQDVFREVNRGIAGRS